MYKLRLANLNVFCASQISHLLLLSFSHTLVLIQGVPPILEPGESQFWAPKWAPILDILSATEHLFCFLRAGEKIF